MEKEFEVTDEIAYRMLKCERRTEYVESNCNETNYTKVLDYVIEILKERIRNNCAN